MKLSKLLEDINVLRYSGDLTTEIKGITYDSRQVKNNYMFICIKGSSFDGHDYIDEAVEKGAVAIIVDKSIEKDKVAMVQVENSRMAMPIIGANFYGRPTEKLKLIGVTGTNGKTTTTYLIRSILQQAEKKTGLIGTISIDLGQYVIESSRTTPESLDLQRIFHDMVSNNAEYAVMEVSSHSLEFGRVDQCQFQIGIFTNLTQDHLDFHKNFENYRKAKEKLFYKTKKANIINIDDEHGRVIYRNIMDFDVPVITYGIDYVADIMAKDIKMDDSGIEFKLVTPDYETVIRSSIPGKFSVYNSLAAASATYVEGIDKDIISKGIENLKFVPGRSEVLPINKPYKMIIDYAHAPDGLENILKSIRNYAKGRIITVFGCGGDRDKAKRPIMGEIAGRLSDYCIITSDNPRSEDPNEIIAQIEEGIKNISCDYICIENRKDAIKHAMMMAKPSDIILLAGKGHETYQVLKDRVIDFDERVVVKELIEEGI
ncbi:UDP-N-acetylmuramoyl-L-alanyl-D-glutamate--2,6-diaminopimelate ligase [Lutispora thermophila]|uniref:UDP-N-acetylmuramoyl-L-alanyl-D-glutamate--2,6-diaminopimelate ligase n=1 Tax=Lutispora thermophila DSM 19022 TaxID=1122184 RepID=A0A1M6CMI2_9FIRM|nr:UDP-N-acetylmuramoyl-L-alanyl-D-glutamate--2,6-diaminopimelate ligase [Lutispora thermophila]SHI62252.1 UDP-N-acetylmuramoylalanyl-D-glutamate--2,6-diaminopimelate ligase [Lutispora thermophila DSM 19022]